MLSITIAFLVVAIGCYAIGVLVGYKVCEHTYKKVEEFEEAFQKSTGGK